MMMVLKKTKNKKKCKVVDLQSPKRKKSPISCSTPKLGKICSTFKSPGSSPTFGSPKSPTFGSPKSRQSPIPSDIQIDDVSVYVGQLTQYFIEKIKNGDNLQKCLCGGKRIYVGILNLH